MRAALCTHFSEHNFGRNEPLASLPEESPALRRRVSMAPASVPSPRMGATPAHTLRGFASITESLRGVRDGSYDRAGFERRPPACTLEVPPSPAAAGQWQFWWVGVTLSSAALGTPRPLPALACSGLSPRGRNGDGARAPSHRASLYSVDNFPH